MGKSMANFLAQFGRMTESHFYLGDSLTGRPGYSDHIQETNNLGKLVDTSEQELPRSLVLDLLRMKGGEGRYSLYQDVVHIFSLCLGSN